MPATDRPIDPNTVNWMTDIVLEFGSYAYQWKAAADSWKLYSDSQTSQINDLRDSLQNMLDEQEQRKEKQKLQEGLIESQQSQIISLEARLAEYAVFHSQHDGGAGCPSENMSPFLLHEGSTSDSAWMVAPAGQGSSPDGPAPPAKRVKRESDQKPRQPTMHWERFKRLSRRQRERPPSPTLTDYKAKALGGTSSALETTSEALRDSKARIAVEDRIVELNRENGRLRLELQYYRKLNSDVLAQIMPLVDYHANGLHKAVKKCNARIENANAEWEAVTKDTMRASANCYRP